MMANLKFEGKDDVLLDNMLYEGKLRYILSQLLPKRKEYEFVAYSPEQYEWCRTNEKMIWKTILENQYLFTSNYLITSQFINDAQYTASLPVESPGRVGVWLGYQIVKSYMKQFPETTFAQLIQMSDSQEFLKLAKYMP
jgi:uncharacterized protein YjaZ